MSSPSRVADRERTFRTVYEALYADVLRFVQRRANPDHAEDVVADVFLVVWRRLDEVPARHEDARAWVFGVARNTLLNARRGDHRRAALGLRLADASTRAPASGEADLVVSLVDLRRAWGALSGAHQEVLGLCVFEALNAPQAAAVLGISPVAFRLRLSRARRALRLSLDHIPRPDKAAVMHERSTTL